MKKIIKFLLIIIVSITLVTGLYIKSNKPLPINVLVLGVDAGDYEHKDAPKRSDTIMLINLDTINKKISLYSIPRDTLITINGEHQKINAVHAIGGVDLIKQKLQSMLQVKIDNYVKVDYEAFKELIDAIGGIDVVVPYDMDYDASDIKIHFKKGEKVHLNGEKAEQYVRWRKNNDGTGYAMGDLGRISTQQEFLVKISQKFKSPTVIFRLPKLIGVFEKNVKTDINKFELIKYAINFYGIDKNNITTKIMSGEPKYIKSISYYIGNIKEDMDYLNSFKHNTNLHDLSKDEIHIKIYNGTSINGLAAKYKKIFEDNGYYVDEIGNYKEKVSKTVIACGSKDDATKIKDIIGTGAIKQNNNLNQKEIVVILGSDSVK